MENFIAHLKEVIPEKDSLKLVKKEAENYYKQHSLDECFATGLELYQSENFQIQEVGVFLVGYAACKNTSALSFLKDTVSQHKSWKVQEILAMAFDNYCKIIGYETAIPVIKEWLKSDCANTRRAVSEGLRIWTSRPYFKEHPQMAIQFLSSLTMTSNRRPIKLYILLRSTRGAVCINAIAIWLITVLLVFLISQKTRAELFIQ